jgi:DNA (cytosine-5)-methyltransferase 1
MDPHCCETLRSNYQYETQIVEADIRGVDPIDLRRKLQLSVGDLDLLCGGPPCQPFSQIGKRGGVNDDRTELLFQMARFAEAFLPKVILIEQVKGVLTAAGADGTRGSIFADLLVRLESLGYESKWRILNSADYGVAQRRQRIIILATRGSTTVEFPEPTHARQEESTSLLSLLPHRTVAEALRGLPPAAPRVNGDIPGDSHLDVTPNGQRVRIHDVPEGEWLAAQVHLPEEVRRTLKRKDTTKFRRLHRFEPSLTLRCGEIFFHPLEDRYLTPREYMRLHGFPDDYVLKGPVRSRSGQARNLDQHRQVANAVPPPMARAIAANIRKALQQTPVLATSSNGVGTGGLS